MLLDSPDVHLTGRDNVEKHGAPGSGEEAHRGPGNRLEEVVGAGHEVKTVSERNGTDAGSGRAQVAKRNVVGKVGQLGPLISQ